MSSTPVKQKFIEWLTAHYLALEEGDELLSFKKLVKKYPHVYSHIKAEVQSLESLLRNIRKAQGFID